MKKSLVILTNVIMLVLGLVGGYFLNFNETKKTSTPKIGDEVYAICGETLKVGYLESDTKKENKPIFKVKTGFLIVESCQAAFLTFEEATQSFE